MPGDTLEELLALEEQRALRQQQGRTSDVDALRQYGGRLSDQDVRQLRGQQQGGGLLGLLRGLIGIGGGSVPQPDPREQRRQLEELRIQNELKRMGLQ